MLNIIGEKLSLSRSAPFNRTPFFEDYLERCSCEFTFGRKVPSDSAFISSDDVFDHLLDRRSINEGIDRKRYELFDEYERARESRIRLGSLEDYDKFKQRNEAIRKSKSRYVSERIPLDISGKSNGESAFAYFTQRIGEGALYLLDEPENSLSVKLQAELAEFIENSARFYKCQFIISTHSPFILSIKGAKIYDLDSTPVCVRKWTELENIILWRELFLRHSEEFDS